MATVPVANGNPRMTTIRVLILPHENVVVAHVLSGGGKLSGTIKILSNP
jgi:hypothetical protein